MRQFRILTLFSLMSMVLWACNSKPKKSPVVNQSMGYVADVNLTTSNETFRYLKKSLASYIGTPQEYLSPEEPFYKINFIGLGAFKASYLEYQSILLIVTDENRKEMEHIAYGIGEKLWDSLTHTPGVSFTQLDEVWAKNQAVYLLYGPSEETIRLYMRDYGQAMRNQMYQAELKNYASRSCKSSHSLAKILNEKYGISMAFPDFAKLDIQADGYYSLNWQDEGSNCNLLIGVWDGEPSDSFASKDSMLSRRIEQGKAHLQMDSLGIYYIGTSKLFPQKHSWYNLNGKAAGKINGWWVIDGQFRGGPYTRYTLWHEASQKWISLEALVYFPTVKNRNDGKNKTRFLRTLETMIHTLK